MPNRAQRRESELDKNKIYVESDGLPYEISLGDLSAKDEQDYSQAVGHSIMDLFSGTVGFSSTAVAGLVWVWRRRFGEKTLRFDEVAGEFKMRDLETLRVGDDDDDEAEQGTLAAPPEADPTYNGKNPEPSGGPSVPISQGSPLSTG